MQGTSRFVRRSSRCSPCRCPFRQPFLLSINIADRHTSKPVNRTLHISCIFCSKKKGTLSDALVHSSKYCQWYPAHVLPPLRAWDIEDGCFPTCIPTSLTVSYTVLSLLAMRRVVSPIIDRVPTFVHRLYGRYPYRAVLAPMALDFPDRDPEPTILDRFPIRCQARCKPCEKPRF